MSVQRQRRKGKSQSVKDADSTQRSSFRTIDQESSMICEGSKSFIDSKSRMKPPSSSSDSTLFWTAVISSQVVGLTCIALVFYWVTLYGGFSWSDGDLQFNYHPVFMITGLIFFYGEAILAYRVFSFLPKLYLKILHASLHAGAIIFASLALVAVFENHRKTDKADLYSLHSWVGLGTFTLFCLQYTSGFITFLFPGVPVTWRTLALPFHTFFGVGIFTMAIATAHMGLTEKLLWTTNYTKGVITPESAVGHSLGIFLILFGFLVVFLTTHSQYKRKPLPLEVSVAINASEHGR